LEKDKMPKIDSKVEDYPVVDYFDDLYNPNTETVGEYLNRLERQYFHDYDNKTKRGIKGWSKFDSILKDEIREAIRQRSLDKAGIKWKNETWTFKTDGHLEEKMVMRDQKGRFLGVRTVTTTEKPIREKPRREVRRS